jgi:glycerol-3-phosphate acyltransferase PlsX
VAGVIVRWMKQEFRKNPVRLAGVGLLMGAFRAMKRRLDPETYGGALLLGVKGVCVITHGASSRRAIVNAVRVACESVHQHLNESIVEEVAKMESVCHASE